MQGGGFRILPKRLKIAQKKTSKKTTSSHVVLKLERITVDEFDPSQKRVEFKSFVRTAFELEKETWAKIELIENWGMSTKSDNMSSSFEVRILAKPFTMTVEKTDPDADMVEGLHLMWTSDDGKHNSIFGNKILGGKVPDDKIICDFTSGDRIEPAVCPPLLDPSIHPATSSYKLDFTKNLELTKLRAQIQDNKFATNILHATEDDYKSFRDLAHSKKFQTWQFMDLFTSRRILYTTMFGKT